jgi:putative Ca2+/H+ antiporter (TMEM165/GDT1 family)
MVAVVAGSLLQLLPATPVRVAAGLGFLVFAVIAARRPIEDEDEEDAIAREGAELDASLDTDASAGTASKARSRPPWLMCFLVVFAAEWGDLTQLATAALVAQTGQPIPVAIGATLALWTVTLLAVVAGSQLSRFLRPRLLKWISVAVFAFVGVVVLISAFEPL